MGINGYRWQHALVTGASSGIGEAIARELAPSLRKLVVTGRDESRLRGLAEELRARFGLDVQVIPADLSVIGGADLLLDRLRSKHDPIDLLVSNAALMSSGPVASHSTEEIKGVMQVDALVPALLMRAVLDQMLPRKSGTILQIGSMAGIQPQPYAATYAASKAFIHSFIESLCEELRGTGVSVTLSIPGATRTRLFERGGFRTKGVPSWIYASPEEVARSALWSAASMRPVSICGWGNRVLAVLLRLAPRVVVRRLSGNLGIRGTSRRRSGFADLEGN